MKQQYPKYTPHFGHSLPIGLGNICPSAWSPDAQGLVTRCPRLGHPMPKAWSSNAHVLVLEEPQIAHRLTAWRSAADLLAGMMKGGVIEYRTLYVREVNRHGKMLEVSIYIDEAEE